MSTETLIEGYGGVKIEADNGFIETDNGYIDQEWL